MAHAQTTIALFTRREDAAQAVARLGKAGVAAEHIGYLEPKDTREPRNEARAAARGIAAGGASGGLLGGVLAAAALGLVPGVGEALVAGALLPVLMGVMTGGATGGVAGGLLAAVGSSEEDPYFMQEIRAGRILVSVEVPDATAQARAAALLKESNALEVDSLGTAHLHARLRHPRSGRRQDGPAVEGE